MHTTVPNLAVDALVAEVHSPLILETSRHYLSPNGVHDPAWWWVKASNLGTPSGVVVRFNLAHETDIDDLFYSHYPKEAILLTSCKAAAHVP